MSGICGIACLDGAPVDRELLQVMTAFMVFRGPDAQDVWLDRSTGFGHTLLRTTFEAEREHQPCSLDSRVWITADARIDGRRELIAKLCGRGRSVSDDATDPDLILHAYGVWGTDCAQYLIGDFAFAIWDSRARQLFCARDHFGIKPFFYALVGQQLVFSNTLNCVRRHRAVADTLNDLFIADFLLFGDSKDPGATAFADIQRLPPAHALTWSSEKGLKVDRYWTLPNDPGVRYRAAGDYVEHFRYLLNQAVGDRLRTNRVGIEMSGGLDSSSIAATALGILSGQKAPFDLQAQSVVYDHLIPDQERHFSGLVAKHLGIPIQYIVADNYQLYENWDQPETCSPEPVHDPQAAMSAAAFRGAAAISRVFLTGWDGDALLSESLRPHFRTLAQNRQYLRLACDVARYSVLQRQLLPPGWGSWFRGRFAKASAEAPQEDGYPSWLSPELEARLDLRNRWRQHRAFPRIEHPTRPYAHSVYSCLAQSAGFFDSYDAGYSGLPLEYRHPLMDLRLLDFCLSLPLQPWVVKKHILREAMRYVLPKAVRKRPKSPLAGFPQLELLKCTSPAAFDNFPIADDLARYVDTAKLQVNRRVQIDVALDLTVLNISSLQIWLFTSKTYEHYTSGVGE